jgi:gamma-glutamyltranspeptidase
MHHQWLPDKLELEDGFSTASVEWLKARGHEVAPPPYQARVQAVARNPNGTVTAVFDPRDMGGAEAK